MKTAFADNGEAICVTRFRYPGEEEVEESTSREIYLAALRFQADIRRWSRTRKAADIRLDASEYLVNGKPFPADIARRHKVSERRVLQAVREVKRYLGIS